jgi:heat-inducible transcriptional repressor
MFDTVFPGRRLSGDPELNERQRVVFAALVHLHGGAGRPVGADRIARDGGLRLSGGSVRAALADLEDLGLLERRVGSTARVPTTHGYDYFVRTLLEPAVLPAELEDAIDAQFAASAHDVERMLQDASRLLGSLTHQLGLALAVSLDREVLEHLDVEPLSDRRVLLHLGLGGHSARSLVLELETPLERAALEQVESVLRERLLGRPLAQVRERLDGDPELARHAAVRIVARAAAASWTRPLDTQLLSSGARHIAQQPEFASPHDLGGVLHAVETGDPLNRLMVRGIPGQAGARIGLGESPALAGCSLVSFSLPGAIPGAVGVLGPVRMDYAFTLAVVERVGTRIADLLSA